MAKKLTNKSTDIVTEPVNPPDNEDLYKAAEESLKQHKTFLDEYDEKRDNLINIDSRKADALEGEWADYGSSIHDKVTFNPYEGQLNEIRAEDQGFWEKIGLGIASSAPLTATTFIDNTVGFVYGLGSAVKNKDMSRLWDNDVTNAMKDLNDYFSKQMPFYKSRYGDEGLKYLGNFIGEDLLKNTGFYMGTAASVALMTALTGGSAGAGFLTKALTKFGMSAAKATKYSAIAKDLAINTISSIGESSVEALDNKRSFVEYQTQLLNDDYNARYDQIEREWQNVLTTKYGGDIEKAAKSSEYHDYNQKLLDLDNYKKNREKFIQAEADKVGDITFLANMAILGGGNFLTFGKALSGGYGTTKRFADGIVTDIVDKSGKTLAKNVSEKEAIKVIESGLYNGTAAKISERGLAKNKLIQDLVTMAEEGSQEMFQGVSSEWATGIAERDIMNYEALTDDQKSLYQVTGAINSMFDNLGELAKATGKVWTDPDQWRQFFGGAFGVVVAPSFSKGPNGKIKFALNNFARQHQEINEYNSTNSLIAEQINRQLNSNEGQNALKGLLRHKALDNIKSDAVANDDKMEYEDADFAQFVSDIATYSNAGKLGYLRASLNNMKNMTDEELEETCMNLCVDVNGKKVGEFVDNNGNFIANSDDARFAVREKINKRIDKLQKDIDLYQDAMHDIDSKTGGQLNTTDLSAFAWEKCNIANKYSRAKSILGSEGMSNNIAEYKSRVGTRINTLTQSLNTTQDNLKLEKDKIMATAKKTGKEQKKSEYQKQLEEDSETLTQEIKLATEASQLLADLEMMQVETKNHKEDMNNVKTLFSKYKDFAESMPEVAKLMGVENKDDNSKDKKVISLEGIMRSGNFDKLMNILSNNSDNMDSIDDMSDDFADAAKLYRRAMLSEKSMEELEKTPTRYITGKDDIRDSIMQKENEPVVKEITDRVKKGIESGEITFRNLDAKSREVTQAIVDEKNKSDEHANVVRKTFDKAMASLNKTPYEQLRQLAVKNILKDKKYKHLKEFNQFVNTIYLQIVSAQNVSDNAKKVAVETFNKIIDKKTTIEDVLDYNPELGEFDVKELYNEVPEEIKERRLNALRNKPEGTELPFDLSNYMYTEQSVSEAEVVRNEAFDLYDNVIEKYSAKFNGPKLSEDNEYDDIDTDEIERSGEAAENAQKIRDEREKLRKTIAKSTDIMSNIVSTFKDGQVLEDDDIEKLEKKIYSYVDKTFDPEQYSIENRGDVENLKLEKQLEALDILSQNIKDRISNEERASNDEFAVEFDKMRDIADEDVKHGERRKKAIRQYYNSVASKINEVVGKLDKVKKSGDTTIFSSAFDKFSTEDKSVPVKKSKEGYYMLDGKVQRGNLVPCKVKFYDAQASENLNAAYFKNPGGGYSVLIINNDGQVIGKAYTDNVNNTGEINNAYRVVPSTSLSAFASINLANFGTVTSPQQKRLDEKKAEEAVKILEETGAVDDKGKVDPKNISQEAAATINVITDPNLVQSKADLEDVKLPSKTEDTVNKTKAKRKKAAKKASNKLAEQLEALDKLLFTLEQKTGYNGAYHNDSMLNSVKNFKAYIELVKDHYDDLDTKNVVLDTNVINSMVTKLTGILNRTFGKDVMFLSDEEMNKNLTGNEQFSASEGNKNENLTFNVIDNQNNKENGIDRKTEESDRGGRANEAISVILRASQSSGSGSSSMEGATESQDERNERQEELIKAWAKKNNIWVENTDIELKEKYGEPIAKGGESTVYYDPKSNIAIKSKNTLQYEDLLYAIVGVNLHNELFPESSLRITGFGEDSEGFVMIIEQEFIHNGEFLSQTQIDEFVESLGKEFKNDNTQGLSGRYSNKDTYLRDLHEGNVIKSPEGNIFVIDAIIKPKDINEYINKTYRSNSDIQFSRQLSETETIKQKAMADGTFMKAPNGNPTNLTEQQWLQVRTKAFKDWFGDWENDPENASKVVDDNGEPKIMYRGINDNNKNKLYHYYTDSKTEAIVYSKGLLTKGGLFFANNKDIIHGLKKYLKDKYNLTQDEDELLTIIEDYLHNGELVDILEDSDTNDDLDDLFGFGPSKKVVGQKPYVSKYSTDEFKKASNDYNLIKNNNEIKDIFKIINLINQTTILDEDRITDLSDNDGYISSKKELDILLEKYNDIINKNKYEKQNIDVVFINSKNPYTDEIVQEDLFNNKKAYLNNHDGALLLNGSHILIKSDPNQIKSATDNNGEFSKDNDNIYLSKQNGEVFGYTADGKIVLNKDRIRLDTPVHEYTHLWDQAVQRINPEFWKRGTELMKDTAEWDKVVNDPAYANIKDNEDLVASEVHSRLAGYVAAGKMIELAAKDETKDKRNFWQKVVDWFTEFKNITLNKIFGMKKEDCEAIDLETFLNAPVADFFMQTDPRKIGDTNYQTAENKQSEQPKTEEKQETAKEESVDDSIDSVVDMLMAEKPVDNTSDENTVLQNAEIDEEQAKREAWVEEVRKLDVSEEVEQLKKQEELIKDSMQPTDLPDTSTLPKMSDIPQQSDLPDIPNAKQLLQDAQAAQEDVPEIPSNVQTFQETVNKLEEQVVASFNVENIDGYDILEKAEKAEYHKVEMDTFKPAISQYAINDKTKSSLEVLSKNYTYIVNLHEATGAFDYVKYGYLSEKDDVFFGYGKVGEGVDKEGNKVDFNDVILFTKRDDGSYQMLGTLGYNGQSDPETARVLRDEIAKPASSPNKENYFDDIKIKTKKAAGNFASGQELEFKLLKHNNEPVKTSVSKILNGSLMYTKEHRSLKDVIMSNGVSIGNNIRNRNDVTVRVGFFDGGTKLKSNFGIENKEELNKVINFKNPESAQKGHVVYVIPRPDGTMQMIPLTVARFSDIARKADNDVVSQIRNVFAGMYQIYTSNGSISQKNEQLARNTSEASPIVQLRKLLHMNDLKLFFNENSVSIVVDGNEKKEFSPANQRDFENGMYSALKDCLININKKVIDNPRTLYNYILSDVFTTNLSETVHRNAFFTIKPVDSNGNKLTVNKDFPDISTLKLNNLKRVVMEVAKDDVFSYQVVEKQNGKFEVMSRIGDNFYDCTAKYKLTEQLPMINYAKLKNGIATGDNSYLEPECYVNGSNEPQELMIREVNGDNFYYEVSGFTQIPAKDVEVRNPRHKEEVKEEPVVEQRVEPAETEIQTVIDNSNVNFYEGTIKPDENTVFVFGSNTEGRHGAGAAKTAKEQFGAQYGVSEGLTGNAYALPTKDLNKSKGTNWHRPGEKEKRLVKLWYEGVKLIDKGTIPEGYKEAKINEKPALSFKTRGGYNNNTEYITFEDGKYYRYFYTQNGLDDKWYLDSKEYEPSDEVRYYFEGQDKGDIIFKYSSSWFSYYGSSPNVDSISGHPYSDVLNHPLNKKRTIAPQTIIESIKKLYQTARENPAKQFKVANYPLGELSLNGYLGEEMIEMFKQAGEIPSNVIFSKEWVDSGMFNIPSKLYQPKPLESSVKQADKQVNSIEPNDKRSNTPQRIQGTMYFVYGKEKREGVKADTTFDAILSGERTSTTRYVKDGDIDYYSNLRVGDTIEWRSTKAKFDPNKRTVLVRVTKPLTKLDKNTDPEEWSKKEGWSVDHFYKKVKPEIDKGEAYQIEYELIDKPQISVVTESVPVQTLKNIGTEGVQKTIESLEKDNVLSESESKSAEKLIGSKRPKILVASEHTDPIFHANYIKQLVEKNNALPKGKKEFHAMYIITKHDGLPLKELATLKNENGRTIPMFFHFSITSLGGTKYEPGVMKMDDMLDRIGALVKDGTLNPSLVTVRIDPIIPGVTQEKDVRHIIERAKSFGVKQFKFSVMDSYGYTSEGERSYKYKDRYILQKMTELGYDWETYYGKDKYNVTNFDAKPEYIQQIYSMMDNFAVEFGVSMVTCGEQPKGLSLKKVKTNQGCVNVDSINAALGTNDVEHVQGNQRPECSCYGNITDKLRYDDKCASSCVYCYAHHNSDKAIQYYNEDGTLKNNRFTATNESQLQNKKTPETNEQDLSKLATKVLSSQSFIDAINQDINSYSSGWIANNIDISDKPIDGFRQYLVEKIGEESANVIYKLAETHSPHFITDIAQMVKDGILDSDSVSEDIINRILIKRELDTELPDLDTPDNECL